MRSPPLAFSSIVAVSATQRLAVAFGIAAAIVLATPGAAQQGSGSGFLFRQPVASLGLRAGFSQPSASSDVFEFVTDELSLGRSDFASASFEADLGIRLFERLDLVLGGAYSGSSTRSDFRRFVDNNDLPIEQTTSLQRVPVTASAKLYLMDRGRSVGRYAWIPSTLAPYVGAGGGALWYRFRQEGDFINMETFDVFSDTFESDGWTPTAVGFVGLDVSLGPRFGVTGEGRYTWGKASMSSDFSGFEKIDLSAYNASLGFYVRF